MLDCKVKCFTCKGISNNNNSQKFNSRLKNKDATREIYEMEGRTARNLVNWRVPIDSPFVEKDKKLNPTSLRTSPIRKPRSLSSPRSISSALKQSNEYNSHSLRRDIRARYWAYLFENLDRAVNEIYETCESDESIIECKEVIMMLDRHTKDFRSLIERLSLLSAYEGTDKASRPTSLVWEVRTSSPGKLLRDSTLLEKQLVNLCSSKHLTFAATPSQNNKTWADRVKRVENNVTTKNKATQMNKENNPTVNGKVNLKDSPRLSSSNKHPHSNVTSKADEIGDGWEVVQRGGKPRSRGSTPVITTVDNKITDSPKLVNSTVLNIDDSKIKEANESENKNFGTIVDEQCVSAEILNSGDKSQNINVEHLFQNDTNNDEHNTGNTESNLMNRNDLIYSNILKKVDENDSSNKKVGDDEKQDEEEEIDKALMSALNEEDSLEHELERKQEAALESVMEEEADFLRELARQESLEIIVEPEQEVDPEGNFLNSSVNFDESINKPLDWDSFVRQFEENQLINKSTSWGDIMDETECRTPGRVVQVHEKLSSPSRKRSAVESLKQHEEKQAKASELREKHLQDRAEKIRILSKKIEEIQTWKNQLLHQMRNTMEKKLERAEKKRQILLQMRVRKAHEEDTKLSEIAFINSLEAQNKRHEIMSKHQESEARLQDMQEERQRRYVENLAKGAAAEERRKMLAAERQHKLQEKAERRREWENKFEMRQLEKEKERAEAAKAKDREREERMAALREQQQFQIEELQRKIQQKQDETDRRHKEKLEAIQEKASKMSIQHHVAAEDPVQDQPPNLTPYEKSKFCTICNVLIPSEVYLLSHLHGNQHQTAVNTLQKDDCSNTSDGLANNMKYISDAPLEEINKNLLIEKEKIKNLKKKCKKIKMRMSKRGSDYESFLKMPSFDNEAKSKMNKLIKDIQKCTQSQCSGPWSHVTVLFLERSISDINKIIDKQRLEDVQMFRCLGGVSLLCQILENYGKFNKEEPHIIPQKSVCSLLMCLYNISFKNENLCNYLLQSNKICTIIDVAYHYSNMVIPENISTNNVNFSNSKKESSMVDSLMKNSLNLLAIVLFSCDSNKILADKKDNNANISQQVNDVVSYIICIGIPDLLSQFFNAIRDSIDHKLLIADILESCLGVLIGLVKIATTGNCINFEEKKVPRSSQLSSALQDTLLTSIVSMLYGILLHSNAPSRGDQAPPTLPPATVIIIKTAIRLLSSIACYDLQLLQKCLGEEGTSLEFRHICSHLLWYCQHYPNDLLLHELILCIGYFTLQNSDNQLIIQSGQPPTILQQLCSLPFAYFSDPRQMTILFPTLICCCFKQPRNKDILKLELSATMLSNFIEARSLERSHNKEENFQKSDSEVYDKHRFHLSSRFPPNLWTEGKQYFEE